MTVSSQTAYEQAASAFAEATARRLELEQRCAALDAETGAAGDVETLSALQVRRDATNELLRRAVGDEGQAKLTSLKAEKAAAVEAMNAATRAESAARQVLDETVAALRQQIADAESTFALAEQRRRQSIGRVGVLDDRVRELSRTVVQ